ncbi:MAG: FMN-binding protein [Deferrisomatales bacterium]|nr:FMN-binding protein [Deferrisomatales bacterium]
MKDTLYPILFMAVLASFFGAVVSSLALITRDRVVAGERAQFRQHVLAAFHIQVPLEPEAVARTWEERIQVREDAEGEYYLARAEDGSVLGYGFRFTGPGFWGPISGLLAVKPGGEELLGLSFTRHQETPGLGGRITEKWFRDQFEGKPLLPLPDDAPALSFVFREPRVPREVEAITGATQTITRLEEFLNRFLADVARRPVLEGGSPR